MLSSSRVDIFFTNSPLSCIMMILAFFILASPMIPGLKKERKVIDKFV
jgi:TctA family transporter